MSFFRVLRGCLVSYTSFGVEAWDIQLGSEFDLLKKSNVDSIIDTIHAGKVAYVHVGLPCQSWSRARRHDGFGPGPLRDDDRYLYGLPNLRPLDWEKVRQGNRLLFNSVRILAACQKSQVPWTLENPMTSRVWETKCIQRLAKHAVCHKADFCQYGCPWQKATYFLASKGLHLNLKNCSGRGVCSRTQKPHTLLQGTNSAGTFTTKVAEPYPFSLCWHIASAVKRLHK